MVTIGDDPHGAPGRVGSGVQKYELKTHAIFAELLGSSHVQIDNPLHLLVSFSTGTGGTHRVLVLVFMCVDLISLLSLSLSLCLRCSPGRSLAYCIQSSLGLVFFLLLSAADSSCLSAFSTAAYTLRTAVPTFQLPEITFISSQIMNHDTTEAIAHSAELPPLTARARPSDPIDYSITGARTSAWFSNSHVRRWSKIAPIVF